MPAMSADENRSFVEELEALGTDIRQSADEVRVQIHLAGMDAKDAWEQLQPRVEEFDRHVVKAARELASEAKAAGSELQEAGKTLRAELQKLRDRIG